MTGGLRKQRLQRGLVIAQVAVSVVLLAGAGLLTRTMLRLAEVSTGLVTEEVLTIQVPLLTMAQLLGDRDADAAAKARYEVIRQEITTLPGVITAGLGSSMPLRTSGFRLDVKVEGQTTEPGEPLPRAEFRSADPNYFRAAGIPLITGREFLATDGPGSARVVVLNQALADRLFPGQDPLGKQIAWTGEILKFGPLSGDWRTIVGVVGTTRDGGLDAGPEGVMYMPFAQELAIGGGLVIRADSNVAALARAAIGIVRRLAPAAPIEKVLTVRQIRDESVTPRRLNAALVSSFSLLAVIIAAVGIAGVLAFSVSARTTEIGIRMSLGATRGRIQRMVLGEGGGLLASGLLLGLAAAFAAARVIQGLLFGVEPHDPATYVAVGLIMAIIGLAACWIPALRAARIDPAITMRA